MTPPRCIALVACFLFAALYGCSEESLSEPRVSASVHESPAKYEPTFGKDIRPILSDRCFRCHGPDPSTRAQDLRLDTFDGATATRANGAAIAPGQPEKSLLLFRARHPDIDERMPPPESGKRSLDASELALIEQWIRNGARYEEHWAFLPPTLPAVPTLPSKNDRRNELDHFLQVNLDRTGAARNPEAPRDVLARRVYLTLTGLPPTPEEVQRYQDDTRPDAYEHLVQQLLYTEPYASRYAEQMTASWLDQARYADTSGIHMDAGRSIWPWRDWVLESYRSNKPFDLFAVEQLAGDLMENATLAQRVASGFNRNHITTDEGGAIDAEYLVEYAVDRVATTGSVFLGLTLGCARCHDHKFDPISQEDFYGLLAFFNSIEEPGLYSQVPDDKRALEPFLAVPSEAQLVARKSLDEKLATEKAALEKPLPAEDTEFQGFLDTLAKETGVRFTTPKVRRAESTEGTTLSVQGDGSILASGPNPNTDVHEFDLALTGDGLRLILLEALPDASHFEARVGRAPNGNAVLSSLELLVPKDANHKEFEPVPCIWAHADVEQRNGDFDAQNALSTEDRVGWAVHGHRGDAGGRRLLVLSERAFSATGLVRIRLRYESIYAQHSFGRVRISFSQLGEVALSRFPMSDSDWFRSGPYSHADRTKVYDEVRGPEHTDVQKLTARAHGPKQPWKHLEGFEDGRVHELDDGVNATYLGRRLYVPSSRKLKLSLGSDDAIRVFLDGKEVFARFVERAAKPDQDEVTLDLEPGIHALVLKIVNTGGQGGFFYRTLPNDVELSPDLVWSILGADEADADLKRRIRHAWRTSFAPGYRDTVARIAALESEKLKLEASIPKTMVMKELEKPRDTFVLVRGQYDQPDRARKVERKIPKSLGLLPKTAPPNRLGFAQWLVSQDNPLFARVAVNRLFEFVFGRGIVATSEDFGLQGAWPDHPELLDWLAVTFQSEGYDVKKMLARLVTSSTFCQSSRRTPELLEADPENRLLAAFPRRRLSAEQIRDYALFTSGLLTERLGGQSVRPYQPKGLWEEVSMPGSNTRVYERTEETQKHRRSLYTFWKRACPPPSMMALDAPTREACTVRRITTNTPLQALVLWNDLQFVEAARALAERTLADGTTDEERLNSLLRRVTGRIAEPALVKRLAQDLVLNRARFEQAPQDTEAILMASGAKATGDFSATEIAAWTLIASAVQNLDAVITLN